MPKINVVEHWQLTGSYYCCYCMTVNGVVTKVAPILRRWAVGKRLDGIDCKKVRLNVYEYQTELS